MGLLPSLLGWSREEVNSWLNSVPGQFVFVVVAEGLTLSILWWFLKRRKVSIKALGFYRKPLLTDLALVCIGFVVYYALLALAAGIANSAFHVNLDQKQELGFDDVTNNLHRLMAFVSLVVLPPVVEEIVFRGFLYGGLRKKMNMWGAMLVTSLLFAAPHLLESQGGGLLWIAAVDTLVLSFVLCYLREKTGNLWASIGVHALKNGLAFLYLFILVH